MRARARWSLGCVVFVAGCVSAAVPAARQDAVPSATRLDETARAGHVLSRLTFGARPGDLAAIERMGVDAWLDRQLHPDRIADGFADSVLATLETQRKLPFELIADHLSANELTQLTQRAVAAVSQAMDSAAAMRTVPAAAVDATKTRAALQTSPLAEGYRRASATNAALAAEVIPAKLMHAALSERQLQEVMVDFWENHFSVSANKVPNKFALAEYDRVVIRPHALGKFRDLLGAVAHSPVMLYYLDNNTSVVDAMHPATGIEAMIENRRRAAGAPPFGDSALYRVSAARRAGLNENYARELMELHTLGVDGGYTQHDVVEVARCLTGWTIERPELGGRFLFRPEAHDGGPKVVLGVPIAGARGMEDGEQVLDILSRHPSTAHYIALKLVTHFVSDSAPPALVSRVAATFTRTDGDIAEVMRTIVTSPEFNSRAAYRAKVKTPFELVVSAARVMSAPPDTTGKTAALVAGLGQPIWGHLTPDGWPDQGIAWMNTGSMVNRLNFGSAVAAGKLPGVVVAKWPAAARMIALSDEAEVRAVIDLVLGGDASMATRQALLSVAPASSTGSAARYSRLADLIGTAIGSPEFQQR